MISDRALSQVVWRSLGILERLHVQGDRHPDVDEAEAEGIVRRIFQLWRASVAGDDDRRWTRRLEWSGLSAGAFTTAVAPDPPSPTMELPRWATLLREMLSEMSPARSRAEDPEPIPFEDALAPMVEWATNRWKKELPSHASVFSAEGVRDAQRFLLRRLSDRAALVLLQSFRAFDASKDSRSYEAFTHYLVYGGWTAVLMDHPVLARQVGTTVDSWIEFMAELGARLDADAEELREAIEGLEAALPLRRMEIGAGDPHGHGRSTTVLTFRGGDRVVYKPRNLAAEAGWFRLLDWINRTADQRHFRVVDLLEKDGYGWMGFVEHRGVRSEAEARRYYRNAGRLICLVYVMGGVDFHFENVISSGTDPVLVDLEAMLQPRRATGAAARRERSVLAGGLLPRWDGVEWGTPADVSALGCQAVQEVAYPTRVWRLVNTDRMSFEELPTRVEPAQNRPHDDESGLLLSQFGDEVLDGFGQMYRWIHRRSGDWLAESGPLGWFGECEIRYLFRPSMAYQKVLDAGAEPRLLRDGIAWSLRADAMNAAWLSQDSPPSVWPLVPHEHRDLLNGDIPRFATRGDSVHLPLSGDEVIADCFASSGTRELARGIERLSEEDLARQTELIGESLRVWEMVRTRTSDLELYLAVSLLPRGGSAAS